MRLAVFVPDLRKWIGAAWLLVGLSMPVLAQQAVVQLVPASDNVVESRLTIGVAAFSTELRLRNLSTDPATGLRRLSTGTFLVRSSDGASVPATWTRIDKAADPLRLAPGEEAVFTLSATLPQAGDYVTWIEAAPLTAAGQPDAAAAQRIRLVVTRTAALLPSEFLDPPLPVGVDLDILTTLARLFGQPHGAPKSVLLRLRNATTAPVEFMAPEVVSYAAQPGDAVTAAASVDPPRIEGGDCVSPLGAGESCAARLRLDDRAWFGQYAIGVGVAGVGGGWSERSQVVHVRASAWFAFAIFVLGAAGGVFVNSWRANGRRAITGLIDVARIRERLQRLNPADAASSRLVASALDQAESIEAALQKGADPADDLARINAHVGPLAALVEIGRGLTSLSAAGQAVLRPKWTAVTGQIDLAASPTEKAAVDGALNELASDVVAWPKLETASGSARRLAEAVAGVQSASDGQADAAVATRLVDQLRQAVETARAPSPAGAALASVTAKLDGLETAIASARTDAAAYTAGAATKLEGLAKALLAKATAAQSPETSRIQAVADGASAIAGSSAADGIEARLGQLATLWQGYVDLDASIGGPQPGMMAEATAAEPAPTFELPAVPGIDLPVNLLLPPSGSALALLERTRRRNEWLTNGLVLVATGLAGVVTLWLPDPNWGSVGTMIAAFLAGMAANVVVGGVVSRQ